MKQRAYVSPVAELVAGLLLFTVNLPAAGPELSASNISRYAGNGRWEWTVFIKGPSQVLKEIGCVEYTLPPSFPKPVRKVCDDGGKRYPFGLKSDGWGTFEISIRVLFKNGDVRFLKHMLTFETPSVERPVPIKAGNLAKQVRSGWWNWTVFIEGPKEVLDQVRCVEYTLHPTFPNPVRAVCDRGKTSRAFPLSASGWGTFRIPIRVFFKDGRVQQLSHDLQF